MQSAAFVYTIILKIKFYILFIETNKNVSAIKIEITLSF